jgi:hypothetical protein
MNLAVYGINGRNYLLLERLKSNDGDEYLYFQSENNGEYLIRKVDINNRVFIIPLENDLEVVKAINLLINKEELNLN